MTLAILSTHPIQYQVPVYRTLQQRFGIPVTAVFGSDFSLHRYHDAEFNTSLAWDVDLLSGYSSRFLHRTEKGAAPPGGVRNQARRLTEILTDVDPGVIMATGYMPTFDMAACLATRRMARRSIFRAETSDQALRRSWIKSTIRDVTLRRLYRGFDRLLYIGENSREHYERLGCAADKLGFSPYCIDASVFRPGEDDRTEMRAAARNELGIDEDRVVLLFSGKLSPRKAPDQLFSAVERLPPEVRERIDLVYVGAGELSEALEVRGAATTGFRSHFLGFRNQTELSRWYHMSDILIFPSQWSETWGLVTNEALHHGVPCVISDQVGCHADLIRPGITGDVFRAGDTDDLARAIRGVVPLKGRAETRDACRERVGHYTVEQAALGIAEAYFDLVGHSAGGTV